MSDRRKLSDILAHNTDRDQLQRAWKATAAAAEFAPLPAGEYTFRIASGDLFTSKRGTPGYKLTLEVTEGNFEGRRAWCDFWLTQAALPMTKRDLLKIGVKDLDQLERPLPSGILLKGKLAVRSDDEGKESNRLVRFECIGVEPEDPFAPKDDDLARSANLQSFPPVPAEDPQRVAPGNSPQQTTTGTKPSESQRLAADGQAMGCGPYDQGERR